ncbi:MULTISPECIES: ADP compounds hydrolase NudE [unclassified Tatumella]|uniref:ADP compounds hydrolase NudE n=1 Tax=unclassified Tatumella TaxID=2649542 RepID=UPI001BB0CB42|nr:MULTISPECIES: ADP compounds hydrolase NudE [unclassified Tatumella]MBS0855694.1 ADP compounds hydrolase NudE [Tatumella sp. JGM16]MBS0893200.1 ADP compounds hydrolase NudE [Tatumella sp. JGM130]MBS0912471.1 ADP compounds hydrolase NudE [Tatumella sp. JGM91]
MGSLKKPEILNVSEVARSRLFTIQEVSLEFSNGERRVYERMKPNGREAVMILALDGDSVLLIEEYAVGLESYELGFPKGLIDPGETPLQAAQRELKEEVGFGAGKTELLASLTMAPSYFSSRMNIIVAQDLYPEKLAGDEPEPLVVHRWPVDDLLALLDKEQFSEARNISALFLLREWLLKQSTGAE